MELLIHSKDNLRKLAFNNGKAFAEFDADISEKEGILSAVFCGRVIRVTNDYALLDINRKNPAFLSDKEGLSEGEHVIVQVKREEVLDKGKAFSSGMKKGLVVTRSIQIVTPYFVFQPSTTEKSIAFAKTVKDPQAIQLIGREFLKDKFGKFIFRSRAESAEGDKLENALNSIYKGWQMAVHVGKKPAFLLSGRSNLERLIDHYQPTTICLNSVKDYWEVQNYVQCYPFPCEVEMRQDNFFETRGAAEEWDTLISPWVKTPSGGVIAIEQTCSFISFDVNQGSSTLSFSQLNLEAARMLPELILKLQLNGNMIVDFVGNVLKSQQNDVIQAIKRGLPSDVTYIAWSSMGWLEMRRPRTRPTLIELIEHLESEKYL